MLSRFWTPTVPPLPVLDDYDEIPIIFDKFCQYQQLRPEQIKGYLKKPSAVDNRKLFVSVILHLYNPQIYKQPLDAIILRFGLNSYLSSFLKIHRSHISLTIRDCIMEEKIYVDYRNKVEHVLSQLKPEKQAH